MSLRLAQDERLERHTLPQSTLHTPLFAGVEASVLGFEVVALVLVANLSQLRLAPVVVASLAVAALHALLALATRRDRRLSLVFSRSFRYPRFALPWATLATSRRVPERTFPRRLLA